MESKQNRLLGLDALRLVAALFVICQHIQTYSGDVIIRPISRIAIFLFFLISGYFLYDERAELIRSKCLKSIKKTCRIYLWAILIYGIEALYEAIRSGSFDVFYIGPWKLFVFFASCSSPFFPYGYHLWFLIALIESLFIIAVISKKRNLFTYKCSGIVCVLMLVLGVFVNHYFSAMPLLKPVLLAIPTILLGGVIRRYKIQLNKVFVVMLICLFSISSICESQYCTDNYYYSTIPLSFILFIMFKELYRGRILSTIAKVGAKYSLGIYIIHPIVIDVPCFCKYGTSAMCMNPVSIFLLSLIIVCAKNSFINYVSKHVIAKN